MMDPVFRVPFDVMGFFFFMMLQLYANFVSTKHIVDVLHLRKVELAVNRPKVVPHPVLRLLDGGFESVVLVHQLSVFAKLHPTEAAICAITLHLPNPFNSSWILFLKFSSGISFNIMAILAPLDKTRVSLPE